MTEVKNRFKITFCAGILFIISVLFSNPLFAEKIIFSADSMTGQTSDEASFTSLDGHAFIKTESMEIAADKIELSGKEYRTIKAFGNVDGKNFESKMEFTCEKMEYDRETKIATLSGSVNLTDQENDVKASAQIIEYNQDSDIAILQVQVNLTQKDNICKAAYAVYQKAKQLLELSGNAEVKQKEDTFRAQMIELNLDTQDITLSGNVKGNVTATKTEEKKENTETTTTDVKKTDSAEATDNKTAEDKKTE
jgi:lipopolysaccharide export system protein LptA